jgi:hypothetical protein
MITPLQIWLFTRGDSIIAVCKNLAENLGFIGFFGLIASLLITGVYCFTTDRERQTLKFNLALKVSWGIELLVIVGYFFCNTVQMLVPTKTEMAAILLIPKIMNNESIAKIPTSIADLANTWIEELKPKSK